MSKNKSVSGSVPSIKKTMEDPRFDRIVKAAQRKGGKSVLSDNEAYAAAMLALMDAASRFDSSKGDDFLAFAAKRITGQIMSDARTFGSKIVSFLPKVPKNELRTLDANSEKQAPDEYLPAMAPQTMDPLKQLLTGETSFAVSHLLTMISSESRRILNLHLEADNFAELAKSLGTDEMTARKRLRKAAEEAKKVHLRLQKDKGAA